MQFSCEEHVIPVEPAKDYLVRVDVCGLCRSDLHFATSWARDWDDLGHEFGGMIVAVRGQDRRFSVGDRVAVKNAAACLACPACLSADFRSCRGLVVNKSGFSQYADCDERSLVAADSLNDDLLALVEPTNVALDLLHSATLGPSSRVLVLGSGTLGLLVAYLATHHFGIEKVTLAGRRPASSLASELGLSSYLSLDDLGRDTLLRDSLGGAPDRVLVTTPPATLSLALDTCHPGGRILTVGLGREEALVAEIDVRTLIFRRAQLEGVFAVPNLYFEEAVEALAASGKPLGGLVKRHISFDQLESALDEWNRRPHFDGKSVLLLHQPSAAGVKVGNGLPETVET